MIQQVLAVDGLVAVGDSGAHLVGSRCACCNTLYFPERELCANPDCEQSDLRPAQLPRTGVLYSFTVQRYQPPPPFRMDDWKPYALGLVDLGEGVRVMGMMTGIAEDEIRIGMSVEIVIDRLFVDTERGDVCTYKFAPLLAERGR